MSKKMMIFYSFPFNFLWKSLMTREFNKQVQNYEMSL